MTDNVVVIIAVAGWAVGIIALCFGWTLIGGLILSGIVFGLLAAMKFVE